MDSQVPVDDAAIASESIVFEVCIANYENWGNRSNRLCNNLRVPVSVY